MLKDTGIYTEVTETRRSQRKDRRDSSLHQPTACKGACVGNPFRSEDVTLFKIRELFASNLNVFSDGFCEKSKKSQPLRMTPLRLGPPNSLIEAIRDAGLKTRRSVKGESRGCRAEGRGATFKSKSRSLARTPMRANAHWGSRSLVMTTAEKHRQNACATEAGGT
jgi:hypothetical protein